MTADNTNPNCPPQYQAWPLSKSEPEARSSELVGRCVEVGDDDEGQPRLIIHTTQEQLMRFGRSLAYVDVVVTIAPPNNKISNTDGN